MCYWCFYLIKDLHTSSTTRRAQLSLGCQWVMLLSVHRSLLGFLSCARHMHSPYLNRVGTWSRCTLLGEVSLFLHSCPSIHHKWLACCSSVRCLLMTPMCGWEESSIWSWPSENKTRIKIPVFPEYQQIQMKANPAKQSYQLRYDHCGWSILYLKICCSGYLWGWENRSRSNVLNSPGSNRTDLPVYAKRLQCVYQGDASVRRGGS